jgi:hypothetical protein
MAASTFKSHKLLSRQATERVARAPFCHRTIARGTGRRDLENVKFDIDQKVVWFVSYPISESGGAVGLDGLLAPPGAITKVARMTEIPFPEPAVRLAGMRLPLRAHDHGEAGVSVGGEATKGGQQMRRDIGGGRASNARFLQSGVFKDQCGLSRSRPRGRGFPCGWEGERCL